MNNSNTIMLIIIAAGITLAVGYVSSFSTSIATELSTVHIQDVKHNSSHDSDLKVPSSRPTGVATLNLKTDVFNDSANCDARTSNVQYDVEVSNPGFSLYKNTVYGSTDTVTLPVTTWDDSTKSNPDNLNVKLSSKSYQFYGIGGGGDCKLNEVVSKWICEDKIWNGATVECKLVIHYAWYARG